MWEQLQKNVQRVQKSGQKYGTSVFSAITLGLHTDGSAGLVVQEDRVATQRQRSVALVCYSQALAPSTSSTTPCLTVCFPRTKYQGNMLNVSYS